MRAVCNKADIIVYVESIVSINSREREAKGGIMNERRCI